MLTKRTGRRSVTALSAIGVWLLALLGAAAIAQAAAVTLPKTASLSGLVYVDYNKNGAPDGADYRIQNAKISLLLSGDPNFHLVVTTDATGMYFFQSIPVSDVKGTFTVSLAPYTGVDGVDNLGQVYDQNNQLTASAEWGEAHNSSGDPQRNSFTQITLAPGYTAINYNFGKFTFPLELFSKHMFIDQGTPDPMPEPGSLMLLAMAGGMLVFAWRRRSAT